MVCRYEHFESDWYRRWFSRINPLRDPETQPAFHRKEWEWCVIAQALQERGMLCEGRSALGFGVGKEPLPSLLAAHGMHVHATDLASRNWRSRRWIRSDMHAEGVAALHVPHLIEPKEFKERISFGVADMRHLKQFRPASYDVVWSACSLEHLGSLAAGMEFVKQSARLLKPGGIGVHTTEYNVTSNDRTWTRGRDVIYRQKDIEALDRALRQDGFCLARPDLDPGDHAFDREYDYPPFYSHGRQHIKIRLGQFVATSMLLIVQA